MNTKNIMWVGPDLLIKDIAIAMQMPHYMPGLTARKVVAMVYFVNTASFYVSIH